MSLNDLAADLSSGLEVNHQSDDAGAEASSALGTDMSGADPDGAGNPRSGSLTTEDRKAISRASEALKIAKKSEADVRALRELNQQLLQTIANGGARTNGSPTNGTPTPPSKPPYSNADATQMLANGEYEKYHEAMSANYEWQRERDRAESETAVDQKIQRKSQGDALATYLTTNLGLGSTNDEAAAKIQEVAQEVRRMAPDVDALTAEVIARGIIYRQAATGELELDLRQEHHRNTTHRDDSRPPAHAPTSQALDWTAPNRGLPPKIIANMQKRGLGDALKPSKNSAREAIYRRIVQDIVDEEALTEHRAKLGVYR